MEGWQSGRMRCVANADGSETGHGGSNPPPSVFGKPKTEQWSSRKVEQQERRHAPLRSTALLFYCSIVRFDDKCNVKPRAL